MTRFVKDANLGKKVSWPARVPTSGESGSNTSIATTPLVIDGFSLIFAVFFQANHWVEGGSFEYYAQYLKGYLRALKLIGFEPYIILDGGMPEEKLETVTRRECDRMTRVRKIMTSTNLVDGEKSFGRNNGIMPAMVVSVTLQALQDEKIWHRICWNEADITVAELAANLDGVVMSNDSDFFIYNINKGMRAQ